MVVIFMVNQSVNLCHECKCRCGTVGGGVLRKQEKVWKTKLMMAPPR